MIFVTVGNWHKGFDRLIKAVDGLIEDGVIQEKVLMQIGSGSYQPRNADWFDYRSPEQCEVYIQQSRFIIAHAGMGIIGTALRHAKPVIVVPRKKNLGEISDDHQLTTARQLEQENKVLAAFEETDIAETLKMVESFVPTQSETSDELLKTIKDYLQQLQSKKGNNG